MFVLRVRADGDFVEPLAQVTVIGAAELCERIEEVVVSRYAGGRNETAHGEGVDQRVEEMLILVSVGCGDLAASAVCFGVLFGPSLRFCERKRCKVHAQMIFRRGTDPGFRIDGAAQMIVQVRALGHFLEEVAEFQGTCSRGFEAERTATVAFGRGRAGMPGFRLRAGPGGAREQNAAQADR
ncbi:MAG: hypothetical protein HRJ53_11130 [Acidobacteria bacterium Pan2503]|uniref:Uncharacterized protein n=1 Tax=Candidatus Acidiferrum panamense TaxID=2741543 RepID=A0A7V8NQ78_9BACT|nr:hypothetical protein [Candidatus Acidoferrum panamensis]